MNGSFQKEFSTGKVTRALKEGTKLTLLSKTSPYSAYFMHQTCTQHELTFMRRIEESDEFLGEVKLERNKLLSY